MSIIEDVARLKEMEVSRHDGDWADQMNAASRFCEEVTNAAPAMLDVLGEVRAGDAYMLDCLIGFVEGRDCCHEFMPHLAILKKYCHMAARMEAKQ